MDVGICGGMLVSWYLWRDVGKLVSVEGCWYLWMDVGICGGMLVSVEGCLFIAGYQFVLSEAARVLPHVHL